jgi:DNA polymerase I
MNDEVPDLRIRVLRRPEQVSEFWDWLTHRPRGYVAVDTETGNKHGHSALEWWRPGFIVRLIQFGDHTGGWAIPFEGWPTLVAEALKWCDRNRVTTVWHNVSFDGNALWTQGINVDYSNMVDTIILAGLGNYAEDLRALKPNAAKVLGRWASAGQSLLKTGMDKQGWDWSTVPLGWRPYPMYGVVDTCITGLLYEAWSDRLVKYRRLHDLELATVSITNGMMQRGLPVDNPYLVRQIEMYGAKEKAVLVTLAGHGITNPGQNAAVALALDKMGILPPDRKTATGKPSVDGDTLALIDHPLARAIETYRFVHRVRGTYLEALHTAGGGESTGIGKVHPGIKSMEAKTFRMSVENPPLQQLPRDDPVVRKAVVARTPDEMVVSADFGQIEMRVFAALNKDQALLDRFSEADTTGSDFFVTIGRQIYNDPEFIKADRRRTLIKSSMYATIYSGGAETIAATAGVPVMEVVPVLRELRRAYPSVADRGMSLVNRSGSGEAMIFTPTGRRFALTREQSPKAAHKLPNWATQGHSAEILKEALIRLRAAGLEDFLMLPVHDEVLASVPRNDAVEVAAEMTEVMDSVVDPDRYGVAVRASVGTGDNWAEAH